jgi:fatty-acyl-CoA synthase
MNVGTLLTKAAYTFPDKPAIIHGRRTFTFSQFNSRANRLVNALYRLGLKKGDNVAILQHNYSEMLESIFACFKAGFAAVPINFRLHPKELAYIIDHSEARVVIL